MRNLFGRRSGMGGLVDETLFIERRGGGGGGAFFPEIDVLELTSVVVDRRVTAG